MGAKVMELMLERLDASKRELLREADLPRRPRPMLAALSADVFSGPGWIFERKLDGERVLAVADSKKVRLVSRNGRDLSSSYPELVTGLEKGLGEGARVVLDGEVVAFSGSVTSFARLAERIRVPEPGKPELPGVEVYYYVLDLLHLGHHDLTRLPLLTRKGLLADLMSYEDPIRLLPWHIEEGAALHREACRKGWEGVIGKRVDSQYRSIRSRSWLKLKCANRQEFVIGGFTEPGGNRKGFGALIVGYYEEEGETLRYAGKVGTGFDGVTLDRLARLLAAREQSAPPFSAEDQPHLPDRGVHWVVPDLVAQLGFSEWTSAGRLRYPRFLGLRRDKDPVEVIRERPVSGPTLPGDGP